MALIAMLAAFVSSSDASDGGIGTPGRCSSVEFGDRTLRAGDCGRDVKTLNWLLNSKRVAQQTPMGREFESETKAAVSGFQENQGLEADGVVDAGTGRELERSMRQDRATWYGPGFYGNKTACGQRLRRATVGVAHRTLPCGTKVAIRYGERYLRTKVIDRGPFTNRARWDLTGGAAKKLDFTFTDKISVAVIP